MALGEWQPEDWSAGHLLYSPLSDVVHYELARRDPALPAPKDAPRPGERLAHPRLHHNLVIVLKTSVATFAPSRHPHHKVLPPFPASAHYRLPPAAARLSHAVHEVEGHPCAVSDGQHWGMGKPAAQEPSLHPPAQVRFLF